MLSRLAYLPQAPRIKFYLRKGLVSSEKCSISRTDEESDDNESTPSCVESEGLLPRSSSIRTHRRLRPLLASWPACLIVLGLSILFGILFAGIVHLFYQPTHKQMPSMLSPLKPASKVMIKPCGNTPEEAQARGCHFDVISFSWLPEECYDGELSADFDASNELEWFRDPEKTQPLSHEQIMSGKYSGLYVNWEYHLRHCTAMWKKMHRAILGPLGKAAIDSYIGPYPHTEHCEHMLLGDRSVTFDMINTIILIKYPDCGID